MDILFKNQFIRLSTISGVKFHRLLLHFPCLLFESCTTSFNLGLCFTITSGSSGELSDQSGSVIHVVMLLLTSGRYNSMSLSSQVSDSLAVSLKAVNYYYNKLHLRCCIGPRSFSGILGKTDFVTCCQAKKNLKIAQLLWSYRIDYIKQGQIKRVKIIDNILQSFILLGIFN